MAFIGTVQRTLKKKEKKRKKKWDGSVKKTLGQLILRPHTRENLQSTFLVWFLASLATRTEVHSSPELGLSPRVIAVPGK